MKISKQAKRNAKTLFRHAQVSGVLDENRLQQVVAALAREKPRGYLPTLAHLQHLTKLDAERRTARVESPAPLDAESEARVKESLGQRYGRGLHFSFHTNPALVGGLRIRVGSDVYDGTIAARLKQLEETLEQ